MFKAFIFDLDGTTADSLPSLSYTVNRSLVRIGLGRVATEKFKFFAGDGAVEMLKRTLDDLGDREHKNLDRLSEIFFEEFETGCLYGARAYDGLVETLSGIKKRGLKLGVLSNKVHGRAVELVETLYGEGFFDYILGQKDTYKRKPSPEGALIIADAFGLAPAQCVYVGDTSTDMKTAVAAGMFPVGVLWGFRGEKELRENGARAIVKEPIELAGLL